MGCAASATARAEVDPGTENHGHLGTAAAKEKEKVLQEQLSMKPTDMGSLSGSLNASVALVKSTELTSVQEFDMKTAHSMVDKRRSTSHAQGSKVLPEPEYDPDGSVCPIISRAPLPPVEPRRRSSQMISTARGSTDGNLDVCRRGSGELLFRPGIRASADGNVIWPSGSSMAGAASPLLGGSGGGALLNGLSASSPGGGIGTALFRVSGMSGVLKHGGTGGSGGSGGSGGLGSPGAGGGGGSGSGLGSARGGGGGGLRNILIRESLKQTMTYVVEKMDDDLADVDCFSEDGDGGGGGGAAASESRLRSATGLAPMRMESISEPQQQAELFAGSAISFRTGSQALLVRKECGVLAGPAGRPLVMWRSTATLASHLGAADPRVGDTLSTFMHAASTRQATYTPVEPCVLVGADEQLLPVTSGSQLSPLRSGTGPAGAGSGHRGRGHRPQPTSAPASASPSPQRDRERDRSCERDPSSQGSPAAALPPRAPSPVPAPARAWPPTPPRPPVTFSLAVSAADVQSLLAPSKLFQSGDSQACLGPVPPGLPPVKQTGHRSIGSRSVGMRSDVSFAVAARDVATPHVLRGGRASATSALGGPNTLRRDSAVSLSMPLGPLNPPPDSGGASPGADGGGALSRFSHPGPDSEGMTGEDVPGSAGDSDTGSRSRRPPKRGGKEWDAKGARWRRASVFQSSAHCAVSLRFLKRLLTDHVMPLANKLRMPVGQVTTLMVNEMVVKELTREDQCRLVDVPGLVPMEDVGEPDYFISHAWGNPFAHLVQCVCDYLSGALDSTKVWIDIAAVNQHPSEQQQDDLANLRNAIYKSKATLMCLDVTGAPLKRVWCLYECDNTITIHGPDRLVLLTPNFSVKDMASVFTSINVMDAGAYKASDKEKILEDIISHHGSTTAFDNKLKLLFLLEPLDMQADLESLLEGTGGTQEYDFSPLQMWLTSPRSPQVCVISGPAGSGKSTISAALCWDEKARHRREKTLARGRVQLPNGGKLARQISGLEATSDPIVHAYHFCKYSDVRRQSPIRIVKTLAYQLAQRLPLLRTYYAGWTWGRRVQQLHQASTAFRLLLLKPLTTLLPRDEQVVLLVDAMDEADTPSQLPLDNAVLQLMLHQLACLPRNVRVITSTRSAPHLMGPLRRKFHGALELTPAMVRKRETTLAALERRLTSRYGGTAAAAVMGCAAGESNLVYYSVVMLLDPPLDVVPADLPACYRAVFAAEWPRLSAQQRSEVLRALQVLMAAREPLQLSLLAALGLENVLGQLPGWGTLLYEREYRVYTLHKSLHDWLSDPVAAGEFHADPRVGHATLARYLFNAAHPLPLYGAKYMVTHLLAAGQLRELLDQAVTDLDHLEAVCRVGYVFRLHAELAAAEHKSRAVADVVRWLGLNSHVLWSHPSAVVQLANEAPNSSAFMIALRRPRRSSTITTELMSAEASGGIGAGGAAAGGAVIKSMSASCPAPAAGPPVTLLNKRRSWPAQLSILAQHHRAVNSVSFNPAGTLLASGSEDRSVRLWDPLTGEQKAVLFGHAGQVLGVAFSPNGAYIASASVDSTVRLWDASTGEEKAELAGHVDWVRDVAFAPAGTPGVPGRLLASCGDDKTVKLWDLAGPQPQLRFTMLGHTDVVSCIAFAPDGSLLASASSDLSIRLWDPTTGRQASRALVAHKFPVTSVCWSPDGKFLASGSHDKLILLWDLAACLEAASSALGPGAVPAAELAGHVDKVLCVNFSPDGKLLVSASADGSMRLWSVEERRAKGVLLGHAANVVAAAFSPTGHLVASAASDYTVRLWDPRVATESGSIEESYASHMDTVTHVAFSPSGHTVASAGADWTVRLWDPSDGNHRAMLQGHTDVVRCVAFSPTGHMLASASSDWTVRLWDPVSKVEKAMLAGHQDRVLAVTWAANSRMLASACHSGTIIVWDTVSLTSMRQLKGHAAPVNALAFSPNSKVLASGSADKTVRLWQPQLGEQQVLIRGHNGGVTSVEYDVSGKLLASSSIEEKMVRVWDPASGTLLCVIANAALCSPGAFSMYSLARHGPCVRAIALKPRPGGGGGGGGASGGGAPAAAAAGTAATGPPSPNLGGGARPVSPATAFGHQLSYTPPNMLQPSMTMRLERTSPNGLVVGGPQTDYTFSFNRPTTPLSPVGAGGAAPAGCTMMAIGPGSQPPGTPPVLQTAMSMRSSLSSMDEIPRLMELVSESDNPIVPIFTPFVSPKCVAVHGNKVVMSDGPHMYFYESNEGKLVGWKSRIQSAGM